MEYSNYRITKCLTKGAVNRLEPSSTLVSILLGLSENIIGCVSDLPKVVNFWKI